MSATAASQSAASVDISLRHNLLQTALHRELAAEFGESNVGIECRTSFGKIDLVAKHAAHYDLYEIKTAQSPRICIREAVGQILEYACWPNPIAFGQLIVAGEMPIDEDAERYLNELRTRFAIPLSYRQVSLPGTVATVQ